MIFFEVCGARGVWRSGCVALCLVGVVALGDAQEARALLTTALSGCGVSSTREGAPAGAFGNFWQRGKSVLTKVTQQ